MFSPQKRVSVFKKHLAMCYRGLTYSLKFLKGPSERYLKSKQIVLPGKSKEKALILDLDETLIHSCAIHEKPMFSVKTAEGDSIGINVRPHCV
jgi:CTD small phosphatase-like protein 2